jgi:hypothetical protein
MDTKHGRLKKALVIYIYIYIYIKEYSPKTVLCFGVLETLPLIIKVHRETSFRELLYFQSP